MSKAERAKLGESKRIMKKNSSSKRISSLCEKLASEFEDWEKIPTEDVKDDKKQREILYSEIKRKMESLSEDPPELTTESIG